MSLRWKLVALYAVILTAVIGGFSVILIARVHGGLLDAVDAELASRVQTLGALVESENGAWAIDPDSGIDQDYTQDRGVYYVVRDARGALVLSSPLATMLGPTAGAEEGSAGRWVQGRHVREASLPIAKAGDNTPGTPATPLRIVCGKDLASVDVSVASLIRQLAILGPLVLLASLAGGFFLVSHALRPIARIARTAEEISATELSGRIDVRGRDELARLAGTLNATFDRLQEGFDRERRFTADASHELRTPLAVVAGNVEVGLKKDRPAGEYKEILADIGEAAARMQAIVEGLLALARADSKAAALARDPVPLAPLCHETVKLARQLAQDRHVTVDIAAPDDVTVRGDRERLKELVSNLVTNAIRYNKDGGRVTIELLQRNGQARLRVDDTGIGIAAKDLPHVFERFYRVDETRSSDAGGVGLGLAIAKWIAEAHGGSIRVESKPGTGTRFEVLLPV